MKTSTDISRCFLPTGGAFGRSPGAESVPYSAGGAIAVHNADFLVRDEHGAVKLHADASQITFYPEAFRDTFLSAFEHRIDIKPTLDGQSGIQIGALLFASRNVVQIILDESRNVVSPTFASGSQINISLDPLEIASLKSQMQKLSHFWAAPRPPSTPGKGTRFINTHAVVLIQDLSEQSNEPSFRFQMLDGSDFWFKELPPTLQPGLLGDAWLSTPNQYLRLDYAWAVGRPETSRYIQFNAVMDRSSGFPSVSPWGMDRKWTAQMEAYFHRASQWIEVGERWFNLSRVSSARISDDQLALFNHPHNLRCETSLHSVRSNPHLGNLFSILGLN